MSRRHRRGAGQAAAAAAFQLGDMKIITLMQACCAFLDVAPHPRAHPLQVHRQCDHPVPVGPLPGSSRLCHTLAAARALEPAAHGVHVRHVNTTHIRLQTSLRSLPIHPTLSCRYITNVINLFLWAPCQGAAGFATPLVMPEGWSLLHMESTPPQGPYKIAIPMYAVLKSGDGKQLAVVIRGTRTAVEWQVGKCKSF